MYVRELFATLLPVFQIYEMKTLHTDMPPIAGESTWRQCVHHVQTQSVRIEQYQPQPDVQHDQRQRRRSFD